MLPTNNSEVNNIDAIRETKNGSSERKSNIVWSSKPSSLNKCVSINKLPEDPKISEANKNEKNLDRCKQDSNIRENTSHRTKQPSNSLNNKISERNGIDENYRKQFESMSGIEAYNQKVESLPKQNFASERRGSYNRPPVPPNRNTIREMLPNNEIESENHSLVQLSRNTTLGTMGSGRQPVLSPNIDISSSSSSDEVAVHNSDSFANASKDNAKVNSNEDRFVTKRNDDKYRSKDGRIRPKDNKVNARSDKNTPRDDRFHVKDGKFTSKDRRVTSKIEARQGKEFSNSVSGNPIDKKYDESCPISSCLGIVSSENKLDEKHNNKSGHSEEDEVAPRKKRVSLSYPSENKFLDPIAAQQVQYDSISGAIRSPSIGTASMDLARRTSVEAEIMTGLVSISKYAVGSKFERGQIENAGEKISDVGLVSHKCGMTSITVVPGKHNCVDVGTSAHEMDITPAMKDPNYENKSSQSETCECWKMCTCRPRVNESIYGCPNPLMLDTCSHGHQTVTCIITNSNAAPKHYTANYSFNYDDPASTQASKT